ncbi:Calx-beta domain-containing protein, partial [Leptolyngbya sp. CCY15150]|uniref:Calx-beta domain-containing protein n=1 Tax=Leptolyngbya sp. CCY15150 TaxID=2767772 RepID=UPI0019524820
SNPSQTDISVDYNTTDGSASALGDPAVGGNDYDSTSGSLTFVAGETLQLITVTVNGDGVSEPSETFNVVLG